MTPPDEPENPGGTLLGIIGIAFVLCLAGIFLCATSYQAGVKDERSVCVALSPTDTQ
jgi:hypothetical protein